MPSPIQYDLLSGLAGSEPLDFLDVNGTVYFTALISQYRRELWKISPNNATPVRITNLGADANNRVSSVSRLTNVGGTLYFRGQSGSATDSPEIVKLYKIDQNTGSVTAISGLPTVNTNGTLFDLYNMINVNGMLYFQTFSDKLWKIDPTGNPVNVFSKPPNSSWAEGIIKLIPANGTLYFTVGFDGSNDTNQLWRIDPTTGNPALIVNANIIPANENADQGKQFININGTIYLVGSNASNGQELWKLDSATGNATVLEIVPGSTSSFVRQLTNVNGTLYFAAIANANDFTSRLWRINPTNGARELIDFSATGQSAPAVKSLTNINGVLYFTVESGLADDRLWKIDSATGNPVPFGPTSTYGLTSVTPLTNKNGIYYFTAYAGNSNIPSLWKIDANSASPAIVTANIPAWGSDFTENLTYVNNKLYFTATVSGSGKELWTIDLATGAARMLEIVAGATGSAPANLKIVNDTFYFTATTTNLGNELWTIDAATGNPVLVSDINLGSGSSAPNILGTANGNLYLSATNGSNGQELWFVSLGNIAPIVANPIGPKTASEANLFTYQIPTTAFRDPNSGDVLTYSIRQSNGGGLPTWLNFNSQTRTLSGSPQTTTPLSLTVTATDAAGLSASDSFSLTITPTRNLVTGTIGNDNLVGTNGADRLIATGTTRTPGYGEIDTITGTGGADMFVLGNSRYVFYDDSLYANAGWWRIIQQRNAVRDAGLDDYALITDFNPGEGDKIQLRRSANQYQLGASPITTKPGTAIFLIAGQQVAELIGVVQGTMPTSLTADYFSYV